MSGFEMKCSGVLSGPDIADNPGVRGLLTHSGSRDSRIRDTFNRRLQPFRYLYDCSGCSRLERSSFGTCTPPENAALPERTPNPTRDPAVGITELFNPGLSHAFDKMRHRPRGIRYVFFHPCNREVGLKPSQCRHFFIRLAGQSGLGEART
jgi:hypothetical protein